MFPNTLSLCSLRSSWVRILNLLKGLIQLHFLGLSGIPKNEILLIWRWWGSKWLHETSGTKSALWCGLCRRYIERGNLPATTACNSIKTVAQNNMLVFSIGQPEFPRLKVSLRDPHKNWHLIWSGDFILRLCVALDCRLPLVFGNALQNQNWHGDSQR